MKKDEEQTSEGLNQIFEIINAKGDESELREIVEKTGRITETEEQHESGGRPESPFLIFELKNHFSDSPYFLRNRQFR